MSCSRIPSCSGAAPTGNAECWLRERSAFTRHCHLLSHLPSILGGKLSSANSAMRFEWPLSHWAPCLALARRAAGACPAPWAPAAKLGRPSLHCKGFPVTPDHSGVLSRRRIPGSPSGCLGAVEQRKRCWAVLSCSSRSGDGHGKTSTRNLLLFLPSPCPSEAFCAWFFLALQGPVRQDGAGTRVLVWGDVGSSPLPCRVHLSPVLLQPGLLGKLCCFGTGQGGSGKQN